MKKRTAPEVIGFVIGWSDTDVRENAYQPGMTSVPVYTVGDLYVCCPAKGRKPPKGWKWFVRGEAYGRTVYAADSTKPQE